MTSSGPVIAITAMSSTSAEPFSKLIQRCGGVPWVVLPDHKDSPEETLRRAGGLLVADGTAIDVGGASASGQPSRVEMDILSLAVHNDLPIVAVGNGFQILNLVMGGTITTAIEGHAPQNGNGHETPAYHRIYIAPGSKLAAIVGSGGFVRVNSLHRHGIREAQKARLLMASAYGLDDGVIEGLESPEHDLIIGVQFQPERKLEVPPHFDRLFQVLVERAAR